VPKLARGGEGAAERILQAWGDADFPALLRLLPRAAGGLALDLLPQFVGRDLELAEHGLDHVVGRQRVQQVLGVHFAAAPLLGRAGRLLQQLLGVLAEPFLEAGSAA
jgi:hypothetical protein